MKTPVLQTERLILRPVTLADAPAIQKYFNNWNIIKHLTTAVPWPYPDNGAEDFIRHECLPQIAAGNFMVWAITLKDNPDEAVGLVHFRDKADHGGQRGFWIAEHLNGKGLMTEAITAMQDFLFFEMGLDRIVVSNAKSNIGSRRVKEKTGAKFLELFELEHGSGEKISEKWEVTRENWARIRGCSAG